jgi:hypothetical protein
LSSSQKFDEAVEFGFPSSTAGGAAAGSYPSFQLPPIATDPHSFRHDFHTFLKDDKLSFLDDGDDDDDDDDNNDNNNDNDDDHDAAPDIDDHSVTELESPLTPSSAAGLSFRYHTRQPSASDISSPASSIHAPVHPNLRGRLDREMTLRMTLTRPDLRASEDALYGWRNSSQGGKRDPFALEDLCFPSDTMSGGAKGPLSVKPAGPRGLVSRLFKKVKGQQQS